MSILSEELALPAYTSLNDVEAAELLNDKTIPSKWAITNDRIRWYLIAHDLWLPIKRSSSDSAELMVDLLNEFDRFDINTPRELQVLRSILDGLIADASVPGFAGPDKVAIINMGDTLISRAQELGIRVDTSKIQRIRGRV